MLAEISLLHLISIIDELYDEAKKEPEENQLVHVYRITDDVSHPQYDFKVSSSLTLLQRTCDIAITITSEIHPSESW